MKRFILLTIILIALLAACTTTPAPASTSVPFTPAVSLTPTELSQPTAVPQPTVIPVQPSAPISGLPQGTDGYPWWNDSVFYEIFVRSFYDSTGDGLGDLNGLISKLDYLQDLGITGLWLMPVQPASSYHGYDVTDYYSINPDYGTLDDFKRLLAEAKKRNIRIIIDFVLNHTSREHPWFVASQDPQSPYREWYVWSEADPGQANWHHAENGAYYYGYFWEGMPDLNYATPAVTKQLNDVTRFWLQEIGVAGLRLDAAKYLIEEGTVVQNSASTHQWYQNFRPEYKKYQPDALTIGEVWDLVSISADYAQGDQLDLTFDFDLAQAIVTGVRARRSEGIARAFKINQNVFKPQQFGSFLTNHDQNRVVSQLAGDLDRAKLAAVIYLTGPGVPFVYYGEELGMIGRKPDEDIRTPMQWSAEKNAGFTTGTPWRMPYSDYPKKNVETQSAEPNSILALYRQLIQLRNQHAALRVGEYVEVQTNNPAVFAMLRVSQEEAALILVNLSQEAVTDYALSAEASPLKPGGYHVVPMLRSDGEAEGTLMPLTCNSQGRFSSYMPLPALSPQSYLAVQLQKS
ncbi:alpha-amylase [Thermoflexales bacterium]|nr:alpha-amylase [Thermoflexales bacterium]